MIIVGTHHSLLLQDLCRMFYLTVFCDSGDNWEERCPQVMSVKFLPKDLAIVRY